MNCTDCHDFLGVYLDGEFAEAEQRAFEEHVRYCPECRADVASERRFVERLRRGLEEGRALAPRDLHERVRAALPLTDAAHAWSWWPPALALAAAATLALVLGGPLLRGVGPAGGGDDEFRGTSLATQEFVARRVEQPVRLPLDEGEGTRLVGARVVRDAGAPAVVFLYEVNGRTVNVLQRPEDLPGRAASGPGGSSPWGGSVHALPVKLVR